MALARIDSSVDYAGQLMCRESIVNDSFQVPKDVCLGRLFGGRFVFGAGNASMFESCIGKWVANTNKESTKLPALSLPYLTWFWK